MVDDTIHNTTYAQFAERDKALGCARELRRGQILRPNVRIVTSSTRRGHAELPLSLTHTWGGMMRGVLVGGAVGLMTAVIVAVAGAADGESIDWSLVALFGALAAVLGSLAGALVGSMSPLPKIDRMEREGDVFVAVWSNDRSDLKWAASVLEKWGARPQVRSTPSAAVQDWPNGARPVAQH